MGKSLWKLEADYFESLPPRCKEMYFEFMSYDFPCINKENKWLYHEIVGFYYDDCHSPIEKIFNMAFDTIVFSRGDTIPFLSLMPQANISVNNENFRADFLFDSEDVSDGNFTCENNIKLVIECDGHEYHHATKEQVKRDNIRSIALKKAGYDIIRFSGTQLYQEPFKCADDTIDYILLKIGEWKPIK